MLRFTPVQVNVKAIIKAGGYSDSCKCVAEKLKQKTPIILNNSISSV